MHHISNVHLALQALNVLSKTTYFVDSTGFGHPMALDDVVADITDKPDGIQQRRFSRVH